MNPQRYEKVRQIYLAVQSRPASERAAAVVELCGADAELRAEVEGLLAADDSGFLASPALGSDFLIGHALGGADDATRGSDDATKSSVAELEGASIGPYRLLRRIGEGGMGSVYEAEQRTPIARKVALKIVKLGMDTREVIARFESERQALAMMDHAHIARVFDAGATDTGRPYFVMELVRGEPITHYCDVVQTPLRERLELFIQVCQAVQHAHTKGIIHRDIKPNNVLVTLVDGQPTPKVIDFGIAKATSGRLTDKTVVTEFRQILGTPAYMSPEQAELTALDIDTRTDVYALGVLLYELLTGQLPFDPTRLRAASLVEWQRIIRDEEPPTPSSRISTLGAAASEVAERRRIDPQRLRRTLSGDLDWIVMKCLEKDRARRYETANGLAADVLRHLNGEAVVAAPPSRWYALSKFVRRNRVLVTFSLLLSLALLIGLGGTTWGMLWAIREAENARLAETEQRRLTELEARARAEESRQTKKYQAINEFVTKALSSSDPIQQGKHGIRVADAMDQAVKLLDAGQLKNEPDTEVALRLTVSIILANNARFKEALRLAEQALAISSVLHDGDDMNTARSLGQIAVALGSLGRNTEALEFCKNALAMRKRILEGDHMEVALNLQDLAVLNFGLGQYSDSLMHLHASFEMKKRLLGADDPDLAGTLNKIGTCLGAMGKPAEALKQHEAALAMQDRLASGDTPEAAFTLISIGARLDELGRSAEALPNHQAGLAMYQRLFPGDHSLVAAGFNNVGVCLSALGRHAEAQPHFENALQMRRRLFDDDHPDLADSLSNLAHGLGELGRPAEALPLYVEALEMQQRLFGTDHPAIANKLNNLAACLSSLGRFEEALENYGLALAMRRRIFNDDHPLLAQSLENFARMNQRMGNASIAEPLLREALAMYQRLLAADHPSVLGCHRNLAHCLFILGRFEESLEQSRAALNGYARNLPPDSRNLLEIKLGIAQTFTRLSRYDEAEPLLLDCVARSPESTRPRERLRPSAQNALVELYDAWHAAEPDQGHDAQAAEWRAKLAEWQASTQPATSP